MEITKFKHACLVLTKEDQSLIIDPGEWSNDLIIPRNAVGVVVTHEHSDHFKLEILQDIVSTNPSVYIYAHVDIIAQLGELTERGVAVSSGQELAAGPFSLRFTGQAHATIHPDYPVCANLGVIVDNGELYYPGDSFVLPDCAVKNLAVPSSAPWMKIAEAMDFIMAVKPETCFPTHNVLLSPEGHELAKAWLTRAADAVGSTYRDL